MTPDFAPPMLNFPTLASRRPLFVSKRISENSLGDVTAAPGPKKALNPAPDERLPLA